jgi:hypothetical protein
LLPSDERPSLTSRPAKITSEIKFSFILILTFYSGGGKTEDCEMDVREDSLNVIRS